MRKMKDSGIAWLAEIPDGWALCKLMFLTRMNSGNALSGEDICPFGRYPVYGGNGLRGYTAQHFLDGQYILIGRQGALCGNIHLVGGKFWATEHAVIVYESSTMNNKFLFYILSAMNLNQYSTSAAQPGLAIEQIRKKHICVTALNEQQRIADFLDSKCASIDRIIEKQRTVIEKLKAYKQSVITEAVTKGLNPDVPMKDSGIEWIGEIPEGWEVSKIRNEFTNLDARRKPISSENRGNIKGAYDYYGASGIIDLIDDYIFDETLILIGEDGANLVMRNLPLIYIAKGKYWVNNHAHILKPINNDLYFMAYQLESVDLLSYITGSTQPKLTQANLSIIPVVVPPLMEQQQIADYLDKKCAEIDKLIIAKESIMKKLTAYKQSLIYEAVTGKMEI